MRSRDAVLRAVLAETLIVAAKVMQILTAVLVEVTTAVNRKL
jgi:hypothetical protein